MADFLLPDLGEGLAEAEVVAWHVQVGDRVEIDQNVVEVETAKAVVEVPIPFAGVVSALHAGPGQTVAVGSVLVSVETAIAPTAAGSDEASGNVLIGYGTSDGAPRARRRRRSPIVAAHEATRLRPVAPDRRRGPVAVMSPLVRKLARDARVDLHELTGTGTEGRIRRRDVEAAIEQLRHGSDTAPGERRIPMSRMRKAAADKLSRSRREIPEATVWVDVDATDLLAARALLNARVPEHPVSLLGLLARFTVLALQQYPVLNARVDGDDVVVHEQIHLGFAAQTDRGLVVPVIRDAHRLRLRELSAALATRGASARAGTTSPAELTGGTFTVNNYGIFGVDGSAAIINHPEVAIVGLGRVIDRPWAVDGKLAVRRVAQLTLAFDHRVCDGGTAGGFLRYIADCVEAPLLALADA